MLGESGLKVSEIAIGAWQASSDWGGTDDDVIAAIEASNEAGVNFVDTAELYGYGHSEAIVGKAIKKIGRDNLVIATKVYGAHLRFEELQKACLASLDRLGVREIDLYQIHWPDPWEQIPLKHTMGALEKLYAEGKIRAIGVSNFAVRDIEEANSYLSKTKIASNQVRYNLLQRNVEEEVLPYCEKNNIAILAWSPLAQGVLTAKYGPGDSPSELARAENPIFSKHNLIEAIRVLKVLETIADKHGKTVSQVALNWIAAKHAAIPIAGAKNAKQAEQNAGSFGWKMTGIDLDEIERAYGCMRLDYFDVWRPAIP